MFTWNLVSEAFCSFGVNRTLTSEWFEQHAGGLFSGNNLTTLTRIFLLLIRKKINNDLDLKTVWGFSISVLQEFLTRNPNPNSGPGLRNLPTLTFNQRTFTMLSNSFRTIRVSVFTIPRESTQISAWVTGACAKKEPVMKQVSQRQWTGTGSQETLTLTPGHRADRTTDGTHYITAEKCFCLWVWHKHNSWGASDR